MAHPTAAEPIVIDGFTIPASPDDVRGWYAETTDTVAQLDDDNMDRAASRRAYRELAAARQAMQILGFLPAPAAGCRIQMHELTTEASGARWIVLTFGDGTASLCYLYPDRTLCGVGGRRPADEVRAAIAARDLDASRWPTG